MPPVLAPVSASPMRLKSWAAGSASACSPSHTANTEISSPSSSSSITSESPNAAAPRMPASTSSTVRQTKTPLPAASPSALITHGGRAAGSACAVGTPAAAITSFAKRFDPSIRAAAAPGPKTGTPAWRRSSATPATSGASGPMTTRSASMDPARASSPSPSSARTGWQCPSAAIPGFPGAACSSSRADAWLSFHASACSRPPDPTISTFTCANLAGAPDGFERRRGRRCGESMIEPGLDRHEWETEWQALEEQLADSPAAALGDVDDLVERMLTERGYSLDDPVAREGDDREVVAEFLAARETTRLVEQGSEDVSPGDVGAAVNGYRAIFEHLIAERSAP